MRILDPPPWAPPGEEEEEEKGEVVPWGIERINGTLAELMVDNDTEATIDVAVLDTGIDYDHPDLEANIGWGFDEIDDSDAPKDYDDKNGHGTHVAGTIAAVDNDIGVIGVAVHIDIYAIKVLNNGGFGTWQDAADGIYRAVKGPDGNLSTNDDAEVISMSFGGGLNDTDMYKAVSWAYNQNVTLVAAAGNEGDGDPDTNEVAYPAKYNEVIAVAATDKDNTTPNWSSEGAEVEVAAPGVSILSTYKNGRYEELSGTSMATPHVSGAVALIIAEARYENITLGIGIYDSADDTTVRGILHITAIDIIPTGVDNYSGYGLIQADAAVAEVGP